MLLEQTRVYEYTIKLEKGKQVPYTLIYTLKPVQLKTLKTYIKINLTNSFIKASKSLISALILFVRKSDGCLCLCVDNQWLNNFIIKN